MLTHYEFCKDISSSSVQLAFWLLLLVCNVFNITSIIMDTKYYQVDRFQVFFHIRNFLNRVLLEKLDTQTSRVVSDTLVNSLQIHYETLYLVTSWSNFVFIMLRTCLTLRSDYVRKPGLQETTRSVNDADPLLFDNNYASQEFNEVRLHLLWF